MPLRSWWQESIALKFIPQVETSPCKPIHFSPFSFFISLSFTFSFLFWPFCTRQRISACLRDVTDTVMEKRFTKKNSAYFFILMTNLESFPDETFITLNVFCWGGNWLENHQVTTRIYSMLTSLLSISVKHLGVILLAFLACDCYFKSNIWISDMCFYIYVANELSSQDRHFEIKMPIAFVSWRSTKVTFLLIFFSLHFKTTLFVQRPHVLQEYW